MVSFDNALTPYIIPPVLSLVIGLTIAFMALFRGSRTRENVQFFFICIFWSLLAPAFICHHLLRGNTVMILSVERVIHFAYVFMPAINLLYFTGMMGMTGTKRRVMVGAAFAVSALLSISVFTDYYFFGLYTYSWGYIAKGGIAFQIFGAYGFVVVFYLLGQFFVRMRREKNQVIRLKLRYILFTFILVALLTMANIPAINGIDVYPLGNFIFLPLMVLAYGVLRHRLMDIRSILHLTLIWLAISSLILVPNVVILTLLYPYREMVSLPGFVAVILAWFVMNYLYFRTVQPRIDQLFNRRKFDLRRVAAEFVESIATLRTIGDLTAQLGDVMRKALPFRRVEVVLCTAMGSEGMGVCAVDERLAGWFVADNRLVELGLVASGEGHDDVREGRLLDLFARFDAYYLVPIVQGGELLAFIVLPEKQNLRPILVEEIHFINSIRSAAAISLANAIMYGNLSELKDSLEVKVGERTAELQKAMNALWGEMQLAKKIQTTLLPRSPHIGGFEIAAYMQPADEVGGDYYDIINVNGLDWLIIGDVSGHGIPAGLIMMMVQTSIHTVLAGTPDMKPEVLLERVNRVITENIRRLNEDKYMTITVLACLKDGRFFFSGLHQDIMIYRRASNIVEIFATNGIWIGLMEDIKPMLERDHVVMEPGDVMLLYTDGITEAWSSGSVRDARTMENDMYGSDRLSDCLRRMGTRGPDEIRDGILADLGGYRFSDDVTMVILKRNDAGVHA